MALAKQKGNHTKNEWIEMVDFFENTCAECLGESGLLNIEKDHIIPIYQGGSNHIRNLQPLCSRCNSSKGPNAIDWRQQLADYLGKNLPDMYKNAF